MPTLSLMFAKSYDSRQALLTLSSFTPYPYWFHWDCCSFSLFFFFIFLMVIYLNVLLIVGSCYHLRPILLNFVVNLSLGLWIHALGCSLLVSMASLVCLVILPVMFGKWFNCLYIVALVFMTLAAWQSYFCHLYFDNQ